MKKWIKNNPFATGLIIVTLVSVLILGVLIFLNARRFNDVVTKVKAEKAKIAALQSTVNEPNASTENKLTEKVENFKDLSIAYQTDLIKNYRKDIQPMTPVQFSEKLKEYKEALEGKMEENGVIQQDPKTWFGFDNYSDTTITEPAIMIGAFQLETFEWLLTELASLKPVKFVGINRSKFTEESQTSVVIKKPKKGKAAATKKESDTPPFRKFDFEVSFTSDSDTLYSFMEKIVNSKEYYITINAVKIKNSKSEPVKPADLKPVVRPAPTAIDFTTDDSDVEEETGDEKMLHRVNGNETLKIDISMSLVLFEKGESVLVQTK